MTIKEASEKYEISADTIRYYERIGLLPRINRNKNGIRNFTEMDCRWIDFIKCMRKTGLSIEALIEYVALYQEGDETIEARKTILVDQCNILTEKMEEIQKTTERLRKKIAQFDEGLALREKKLREE